MNPVSIKRRCIYISSAVYSGKEKKISRVFLKPVVNTIEPSFIIDHNAGTASAVVPTIASNSALCRFYIYLL